MRTLLLIAIASMTACTANTEEFEAKGEAALIGEWTCTEPNIIKNMPDTSIGIAYKFNADGTNQVIWTLATIGTIGEAKKTKLLTKNLYRLEDDAVMEEETSTDLLSFTVGGIEQPEWARLELERDFQDDIGKVTSMTFRTVSDTQIVFDEATDNVICTRVAAQSPEQ